MLCVCIIVSVIVSIYMMMSYSIVIVSFVKVVGIFIIPSDFFLIVLVCGSFFLMSLCLYNSVCNSVNIYDDVL